MATDPMITERPDLPPAGVELKDTSVNLRTLNPVLRDFLRNFGLAHLQVFQITAVVTSAVDGQHATASKHYQGKALDLRASVYTGFELAAVLLILGVLAKRYKLAVFDESQLPGAGHIHVEMAA